MKERRNAVRAAMAHVWTNYRERAWGADEIRPVTGMPFNPWGSIGCMILDSMDTLWIMDMKSEFDEARKWVHSELRFDKMGEVSVFETIIRAVGGLLGAYDMSKDRVLLDKAVELTERLLPAINPENGRAFYLIDTSTNHSHQQGSLAESGTYQLEFEYLSAVTGNPKYHELATKFYPYLRAQSDIEFNGLYANQLSYIETRSGGLTLTMGASGDSFYEYLLKGWILTGEPKNSLVKKMYLKAVKGMEDLLLQESTDGHLFIGEFSLRQYLKRPSMQHLACFVPGMLALGAYRMEDEDPQRSQHHMELATELMETCYEDFYAKQPTGLSPECLMRPSLEACIPAPYKLRPEVVESLFVLHQLTGDSKYQEWGWNIFSAILRQCRTEYGFSEYRDVTRVANWEAMDEIQRDLWSVRMLENRMETFFTAETLKYLYLLFDPDNKHVSLATHVFNTEAHPLSIQQSVQ